MNYMGSKSRLAKYIVPLLQEIIDSEQIKTYIEPFCGGANVIDKIQALTKIGLDKNESLIALHKDAQNGGKNIPESITRESWEKWKKLYYECKGQLIENNVPFEDQVAVGATSFFGSFSAKGFVGSMAKNTNGRNYYLERKNNLMKQAENDEYKNIHFCAKDYQELSFNDFPEKVLFYCDPPYEGTTKYGYSFETNFDHKAYWDWIRELSKTHYVVCSEQNFPDDFEIIWVKELKRTVGIENNKASAEKLGVFKDGLAYNWLKNKVEKV